MPWDWDYNPDTLRHYKRVDFAARLLDFPEDMRCGIVERAAILEFEAGHSRYSAELSALIHASVELERRMDAERPRAWMGLSSGSAGT